MGSSNTEVKTYIKKATELRNEGRLEEALLSARKATSLDPEDANAWWQLALCLEQKEGLSGSIKALQKTVEYAPYFADGWCQLGQAYKKTSMLDKAIECYERALEEDDSHILTLKRLDIALKERDFQKDKNKRINILKKLHELEELNEDTSFNYAFLLAEQQDYIASIKIYELTTKLSDYPKAAYNNLGYNYGKIGRDLDAVDAYRKALSFDESYETALKNINTKLPHLLELREKVIPKSPYLNKEDWYKNYINPFELLQIEEPYDVYEDPKALQKYKQALYREIELEDGKIDWLPGLHIDKSTAIATCEQLSDFTLFEYHTAVFENKALCGFLTRGALNHFLIDPYPAEPVTLPQDLDKDMLAWLGARFSEQYNLILTKSIEEGDLEVIDCLLDGRRWVLPEHEDRCFEGARRALERMVEPLEKLAKKANEKSFIRLSEVQSALSHKKLSQILRLLPAEFTETHALAYGALRTISISIYNSQSDADAAKSVIELGRFATEKSPVISHQFEEDIKVLSKKIQEEKAKEIHLTFGKKTLDITKAGVAYDGTKISTADLAAARWGMVYTSNSPLTARYTIAFKDRFDNNIQVTWSSTQIEKQKKFWGDIVEATLEFLMDALLSNFKKKLDAGSQIMVGPLMVSVSGVQFEIQGWFSNKKVFCPWTRLSTEIKNGSLVVRDPSEAKAHVELPLETVDNAFVLHFLAMKKS